LSKSLKMDMLSNMVSSLYFRLCSILSRIEEFRLTSLSSFSANLTFLTYFSVIIWLSLFWTSSCWLSLYSALELLLRFLLFTTPRSELVSPGSTGFGLLDLFFLLDWCFNFPMIGIMLILITF
jgi:hypothetical protein